MKLPFDHIVITSDEPMGNMYHTQLLFAEYLAKDNPVVFINPPQRWKPKNLVTSPKIPESIGKLSVINYWNRFPTFLKIFSQSNEKLNEKRLSSLIQTQSNPNILIWHFDSYRSLLNGSDFIKKIHATRIYHVIDPYYNNPIDKPLRDLADLIIITSPRLIPYYASHQKKILALPQVLNLEMHRGFLNGPLPEKFNAKEPYVVLIGTFSNDIDYDWLRKIVALKTVRLILIGRVIKEKNNNTQFESLRRLKGVEYLGEMTPREFYPILKHSNAGLIVYNQRRRNAIFSPLKALNYLVASIPVISNTDCEIPTLVGESIFITKDLDQFIKKLQSLDQLSFNKEKTENYLETVSMEKSMKAILFQLTSQHKN